MEYLLELLDDLLLLDNLLGDDRALLKSGPRFIRTTTNKCRLMDRMPNLDRLGLLASDDEKLDLDNRSLDLAERVEPGNRAVDAVAPAVVLLSREEDPGDASRDRAVRDVRHRVAPVDCRSKRPERGPKCLRHV